MLEGDGKAFTGGEDGWEVGLSAGVSEDFEDEAYDGCLSVVADFPDGVDDGYSGEELGPDFFVVA